MNIAILFVNPVTVNENNYSLSGHEGVPWDQCTHDLASLPSHFIYALGTYVVNDKKVTLQLIIGVNMN